MLCVLSLSGCESREDKYIRLQKELAEKQNELQKIVSIQTGLVIDKVGTAPDFQQRFDDMRTAQHAFDSTKADGMVFLLETALLDAIEGDPEEITDERIRSESEQVVSKWRNHIPYLKRPSEGNGRLVVKEMSNLLITYRDDYRTYFKKVTAFADRNEGSEHEFWILEMETDSLRKEIEDLAVLINAMKKT